MRVLHLNTYQLGGAARAAQQLHAGLRRIGHDSVMLLPHRTGDDPSVVMLNGRPAGLLERFTRHARRRSIVADFARYAGTRPGGYEQFSDDRSEYGMHLVRHLPECDVVNLHWVAGFVDCRTFFARVPRSTPVVWTLHDMNAFTGGCHFDCGCGKYAAACGACPQLGSREGSDLSHQVWVRKRAAFARVPPGRLHFVACSHWLTREAGRSSLLRNFPVTAILNGVDAETFVPRDRLHARSVLGVPADASVVLFAADSVTSRRKGFAVLVEALAGLRSPSNLFLLSLGGGGSPALPTEIPHLHLGTVSGDRLLSVIYSAADMFVIPSLQESCPLTALEAMACGTPVVGSEVGGIPEIVRQGVTGRLVPPGDPAALRAAIAALLESPSKRVEISRNCRRVAVEEYSVEAQARHYAKLYEEVVAKVCQEKLGAS